MKKIMLLLAVMTLNTACISSSLVDSDIAEVGETLDYGDYSSVTLATKSWEALEKGDHLETLAYTQKCVELYGETGKEMNAELTNFAPIEKVNDYWALNDAGTCQYIMATVYERRRMYPEAAQAFQTLAEDFTYTQCWDPKGWYWHPASGAATKAKKYAYK